MSSSLPEDRNCSKQKEFSLIKGRSMDDLDISNMPLLASDFGLRVFVKSDSLLSDDQLLYAIGLGKYRSATLREFHWFADSFIVADSGAWIMLAADVPMARSFGRNRSLRPNLVQLSRDFDVFMMIADLDDFEFAKLINGQAVSLVVFNMLWWDFLETPSHISEPLDGEDALGAYSGRELITILINISKRAGVATEFADPRFYCGSFG
jgi:hypothetical protein